MLTTYTFLCYIQLVLLPTYIHLYAINKLIVCSQDILSYATIIMLTTFKFLWHTVSYASNVYTFLCQIIHRTNLADNIHVCLQQFIKQPMQMIKSFSRQLAIKTTQSSPFIKFQLGHIMNVSKNVMRNKYS